MLPKFRRDFFSQRTGESSGATPGNRPDAEFGAEWQHGLTMKTTHLHIEEFDDLTDAGFLGKTLAAVPRVKAVELHPAAHEAVVRHDGANTDELTAALHQLGYEAKAD